MEQQKLFETEDFREGVAAVAARRAGGSPDNDHSDSSHPTRRFRPLPAGHCAGVRILEIAGIGPVPHAAMLLADMGADVVQIGRPGSTAELNDGYKKHVARGRTTIEADLKNSADVANVLTLVERQMS